MIFSHLKESSGIASMGRLIVVAFMLAFSAQAGTVTFTTTNALGADTNFIRLTPVNPHANADGTYTTAGISFRIFPNTSGYVATNLIAGTYIASNQFLVDNLFGVGLSGTSQGVLFAVDNTTNTYAFTKYLKSGYNVYNWLLGIPGIVGTNGFTVTTNSDGTILLDGALFAPTTSQITNALGFLPLTAQQSTNLAAFAIPTNYWSTSAILWLSNIAVRLVADRGIADTNTVYHATNDLRVDLMAEKVKGTNGLGSAAFASSNNFQFGNTTLTNIAKTGAQTNALNAGTNIVFFTNASGMFIAGTATGSGSGVSVAPGTLVSVSTNNSVVTVNALSQTNGFTGMPTNDPSTFARTNFSSLTVNGILRSNDFALFNGKLNTNLGYASRLTVENQTNLGTIWLGALGAHGYIDDQGNMHLGDFLTYDANNGTLTAETLVGDGSAITGISAASITGTFTNGTTGNAATATLAATATTANNVSAGISNQMRLYATNAISGSSTITNIAATQAQLATNSIRAESIVGTLTNATTGNAATATVATTVTQGVTNTFQKGSLTLTNLGNTGAQTNAIAAGTLMSLSTNSGTISWNAANLTNGYGDVVGANSNRFYLNANPSNFIRFNDALTSDVSTNGYTLAIRHATNANLSTNLAPYQTQSNQTLVTSLGIQSTNYSLGANMIFTNSVRSVGLRGGGAHATDGTYRTNDGATTLTNANGNGYYIVQVGAQFIVQPPGGASNLYAASTLAGTYSVATGASPAPTAFEGGIFSASGLDIWGDVASTNLESQFNAKVSTNEPDVVTLTNTGNIFYGTFNGVLAGAATLTNNPTYAWTNNMGFYGPHIADAVRQQWNVSYFGVTNPAATISSAIMAAGSSNLTTSAGTFGQGDVGKIISVYGASNGWNFTTLITNVASTTSITLSNASPNGVTNFNAVYGFNNVVGMRTLMNFAATNGGGDFIATTQYIVGAWASDVQDQGSPTNHANAVLPLPPMTPLGQVKPTIRFLGTVRPSRGDNAGTNGFINAVGGTFWCVIPGFNQTNFASLFDFRNFTNPVIRSTRTDQTWTIPQNWCEVIFENMTVNTAPDSCITALNLQGAYDAYVRDCMIGDGYANGYGPPITHTNWGIMMPGNFNAVDDGIYNSTILGYWYSLDLTANITVFNTQLGGRAYGGISSLFGGGDVNRLIHVGFSQLTNCFVGRSDAANVLGDVWVQNVAPYPTPNLFNDSNGIFWGDIWYENQGLGKGAPLPSVGTLNTGLHLHTGDSLSQLQHLTTEIGGGNPAFLASSTNNSIAPAVQFRNAATSFTWTISETATNSSSPNALAFTYTDQAAAITTNHLLHLKYGIVGGYGNEASTALAVPNGMLVTNNIYAVGQLTARDGNKWPGGLSVGANRESSAISANAEKLFMMTAPRYEDSGYGSFNDIFAWWTPAADDERLMLGGSGGFFGGSHGATAIYFCTTTNSGTASKTFFTLSGGGRLSTTNGGVFTGDGGGLTNISIAGLTAVFYTGQTNIGAASTSLLITIGHTMPSTNYVPNVSIIGSALATAVSSTYSALTTTNFTYNLSGVLGAADNLNWSVTYSP